MEPYAYKLGGEPEGWKSWRVDGFTMLGPSIQLYNSRIDLGILMKGHRPRQRVYTLKPEIDRFLAMVDEKRAQRRARRRI
jgi:hypothetical protein